MDGEGLLRPLYAGLKRLCVAWLDETPGGVLIRVIYMVVPAVILLSLNPFNILDRNAELSEKIILSIISPFYPFHADSFFSARDADAETARGRISVIIIDNKDVEAGLIGQNKTWPPNLSDYANLVRKISKHKPEAIFFDLNVNGRDRDDVERFYKVINFFRKNVSIYFACIPGSVVQARSEDMAAAPASGNRINLSCASAAGGATDAAIGGQGDEITRLFVSWPRHGLSYPLCVTGNDGNEGGAGGGYLSPAARLWRDMLERSRNSDPTAARALSWLDGKCMAEAGHGGDGHHSPTVSPNWMTVLWGSSLPPDMAVLGLDDHECGRRHLEDGWDKFRSSLGAIIHGFTAHLFHGQGGHGAAGRDWNVLSACPYHLTFNLHALRNMSVNDTAMDVAFKGRIVIIGADIAGLNDTSFSPAHGIVQAVHLHAMALDNLLNYKTKIKDEMSHDLAHLICFIIEVVTLFLSALFVVAPAKRIFYPVKGAGRMATCVLAGWIPRLLLSAAIVGIVATIAILGLAWPVVALPVVLCLVLAGVLVARDIRPQWLVDDVAPRTRAILFVATTAALSVGAFTLFFILSLLISVLFLVFWSTSPVFWLSGVVVALNAIIGEPFAKSIEIVREKSLA